MVATTRRPVLEASTLPRQDVPPVEWAIAYARRGWHVFPVHWMLRGDLCSCGKSECDRPAKHPRTEHGLKDATTDEAAIRRWWVRMPQANVGIRTGPESGFFVLDIDPDKGGDETLHELELEHGPLPETVEAVTGGAGRHLLLQHPGWYVPNGTGTPGQPGRFGPGLDTRGNGGYIVAAPSIHRSGRRYEWELSGHPDEVTIAPAPAWVLDRLRDTATGQGDWTPVDVAGILNGVAEGGRDDALFRLAAKFRNADLPHAIAERLVLEAAANCVPPFPESEARKKVTQAWKYPAGSSVGIDLGEAPAPSLNGVDHAPPADAGDTGDDDGTDDPPPPEAGASPDRFKLTDVGNAERLLVAHGAELRYCPRWGKWLAWDGRRWALDYGTCRVRRFARQTARRFSQLTTVKRFPLGDVADPAKACRKHASYSESGRGIGAMVTTAETFPALWVTPDELDADPWRLNCANGTIDLLTGQLRPHRPEDLMTLIAPVNYDPKAKATRWEKFITEVTATAAGDADPKMATYLQRALGHGLTGDVSEQSVYFAYGAGDNGKSTLLNTVRGVLGEYAMQATEDLLMVKRGEQHPTERADLYRKRLVVSTEVEDGRRLAEALVKQLTGGENIRARRMREDHWEFAPTHKVWVGANHMPEIRGTDWAIWRRIRVMPFESRFYESGAAPDGQEHRVKDKQLPEKLRLESPGVLAWLVRGCLAWKRVGLTIPPRVVEATKGYRDAMDVLGEFIAERCVIEKDATALATPLYRAYVGWAEVGGEKPETQRRFGLRLKERGYTNDTPSTEKDSKGYAQWTGLKLKPISQDTGDRDIGLKASPGNRWGEAG